MPPKKGTSTPNKPPENPTWTLDEGEEMCRDINELQNKMDSMEAKLDTKMDSMEAKLDGLKWEIMEVLKNFVTEKTPESENASHEIHDEDTRNIPKIDMRKFDGKDPITWILQISIMSNSLISIMCHIHKMYELLLYI
jgi:hypothetical protein